MPMKQCNVSYCRTKVPLGTMYCDKHKGDSGKEYNKRVRYSKSNSKYSKFYHTPEWRKTRKAKLLETPYCEVCMQEGITRPAQLVHHVIELKDPQGWELRLDTDNLQSICYTHHNMIEHKYSNHSKLYNKE